MCRGVKKSDADCAISKLSSVHTTVLNHVTGNLLVSGPRKIEFELLRVQFHDQVFIDLTG